MGIASEITIRPWPCLSLSPRVLASAVMRPFLVVSYVASKRRLVGGILETSVFELVSNYLQRCIENTMQMALRAHLGRPSTKSIWSNECGPWLMGKVYLVRDPPS